MSTLYIFGNGFDLAHNIKTRYSDFRNFLKCNHENFLLQFEGMYHIQPLDDTEPWYTDEAQARWEQSVCKNLWGSFEEEIGFPDAEGMYDEALSLVDVMPEEGIKDTLDFHWKNRYCFSENLQKYVLEWLRTVDTSKISCKKQSLKNSNSDIFINFNYTDVLEKIYGLKNVFHIHGGIPSCSDVPPIMGHGNKVIIDLNLRKASQYLNEGVEWAASIHAAIARFCKSLYKDTDEIIRRNEDLFSSVWCVNQIVCLGISFGDVDVEYLQRIVHEINPQTKWIIYYYSKEDFKRIKNVFGILGITRKFEVCFLQSDSFWDK